MVNHNEISPRRLAKGNGSGGASETAGASFGINCGALHGVSDRRTFRFRVADDHQNGEQRWVVGAFGNCEQQAAFQLSVFADPHGRGEQLTVVGQMSAWVLN